MKTIIVLGMHRSATSLVAKGLHDNDVHMGGGLLGASPSNPRGHWENREMVRFNDLLLGYAGGSWDNPPHEDRILDLGKTHRHVIRNFMDRQRAKVAGDIWGWKDPRTTLTIELLLPHLENPHFVCCFREPREVAESLMRRNGFSLYRGIWLAYVYNKRLTDFLKRWNEQAMIGWMAP